MENVRISTLKGFRSGVSTRIIAMALGMCALDKDKVNVLVVTEPSYVTDKLVKEGNFPSNLMVMGEKEFLEDMESLKVGMPTLLTQYFIDCSHRYQNDILNAVNDAKLKHYKDALWFTVSIIGSEE